eukprot:1159817-Pelagomonas_calceolata.AAC.8
MYKAEAARIESCLSCSRVRLRKVSICGIYCLLPAGNRICCLILAGKRSGATHTHTAAHIALTLALSGQPLGCQRQGHQHRAWTQCLRAPKSAAAPPAPPPAARQRVGKQALLLQRSGLAAPAPYCPHPGHRADKSNIKGLEQKKITEGLPTRVMRSRGVAY